MRAWLLLPALSGCFLLPWADEIRDKAEQVGEAVSQAGAHPAKRKKPPVPVPLPPDCDLADHCRGKEECAIGGGRCCSKCKQACLEMSE